MYADNGRGTPQPKSGLVIILQNIRKRALTVTEFQDRISSDSTWTRELPLYGSGAIGATEFGNREVSDEGGLPNDAI